MLGLGLANRVQDSTSVLRQSETDLKNERVNSNSRTFQKNMQIGVKAGFAYAKIVPGAIVQFRGGTKIL